MEDTVGRSLVSLALILLLVVLWSVVRRVRRYFQRSLKARQDLARCVSDLTHRLERLERKLDATGETEQ